MRKLILILSVLSYSLSSCGQTYKEYNLKEIGWSIKIPGDYVVQDTFSKLNYVDANGNKITDPAELKELEADLMKGLLIVSSRDRNNIASFNLQMESSRTGNFEKYYDFSKTMQFLMSSQQTTDFDTASSILRINNISLRKFLTSSRNTSAIQYSGIYLAQLKNYFLIIKADYIDKKFEEEIEKAIVTSKFD